jgi:hypothetical protein
MKIIGMRGYRFLHFVDYIAIFQSHIFALLYSYYQECRVYDYVPERHKSIKFINTKWIPRRGIWIPCGSHTEAPRHGIHLVLINVSVWFLSKYLDGAVCVICVAWVCLFQRKLKTFVWTVTKFLTPSPLKMEEN